VHKQSWRGQNGQQRAKDREAATDKAKKTREVIQRTNRQTERENSRQCEAEYIQSDTASTNRNEEERNEGRKKGRMVAR